MRSPLDKPCSTPYGIRGRNTAAVVSGLLPPSTGAQRLTASEVETPSSVGTVLPIAPSAQRLTASEVETHRWEAELKRRHAVLNALRHQR